MLIKFRSKKYFCRSSSKLSRSDSGGGNKLKGGDQNKESCNNNNNNNVTEIKWELRPGGMLVQRRENSGQSVGEETITIRVSTVSQWHDISIEATSTFGKTSLLVVLLPNILVHCNLIPFRPARHWKNKILVLYEFPELHL